jgi:hypothetical protein
VALKISNGHAVTTILIAMVAMMLTAVSYGRMAGFPQDGAHQPASLRLQQLPKLPTAELVHNAHLLFESQPATEKRNSWILRSPRTWKGGELTEKYRQPFDYVGRFGIASEPQRRSDGIGGNGQNDIRLHALDTN